MRVSNSKTVIFAALLGCFLCSVSDVWFVSAYSQHRPTRTSMTTMTTATEKGRREILAGMVGILSLAGLPHEAATASESILSSKYCAYGEGTDCEALAEGNPYILELQRKSAANKQANMASAKNAFYAKNYPDWFAAVGKTMVQKESDATFVVIDNSELAKLWDEGKIKTSTPMTLGGKIKDVTQKPMLILKDDATVVLQDDSLNDSSLPQE